MPPPKRGPYTPSGTVQRLCGSIGAALAAPRFDESGPYSGTGSPVPVGNFVFANATLSDGVPIATWDFDGINEAGEIDTEVPHGLWTTGSEEEINVSGTSGQFDTNGPYLDGQAGGSNIQTSVPATGIQTSGTGGLVVPTLRRVSACGSFTQSTIANMLRRRTTAGSAGCESRGSTDHMVLSPTIALTAAAGWTIIIDYTPLASQGSNILGSPGQAIENRIRGDVNFQRAYTSAGTLSPAIASPMNDNRRITVWTGNSTFWRARLNGGAGAGAASTIGNFTISHLNWKGTGSNYANLRYHNLLIYNSVLSLGDMNTISAALAADTSFGAVTWTTAT